MHRWGPIKIVFQIGVTFSARRFADAFKALTDKWTSSSDKRSALHRAGTFGEVGEKTRVVHRRGKQRWRGTNVINSTRGRFHLTHRSDEGIFFFVTVYTRRIPS